jgi:4-hydroxy-tetrahydrodipicolinate reductase
LSSPAGRDVAGECSAASPDNHGADWIGVMSDALKVLLVGARGRMGQAIEAAAATAGLTITTRAEKDDALSPLVDACDVVIDFSAPDVTAAVVAACLAGQRPLVLGTTGHSTKQRQNIGNAAQSIAIVFSANFSIGMNVLFALTRQAAALLGEKFDRTIIEAHHRTKKDAPSGTAKRLAEILAEKGGAATVHSLRAGDIVGDHQVIFAGQGERLELVHRAGSRETFARGALQAARWVIAQSPGLYSMGNVLGL